MITKIEIRENFLKQRFDPEYSNQIERFKNLSIVQQLAWILAIFESDGSLSFTYRSDSGKKSNNPRNYRVDPYYDISQTQRNKIVPILVAVFFLDSLKNKFNFSLSEVMQREQGTVQLRFYTINNTKSFFQLIRENMRQVFLVEKYYDELILRKILSFSSEERATTEIAVKILDLKYKFHQPGEDKLDIPSFAQTRKERVYWEEKLDLEIGSSNNAAIDLLKDIQGNYDKHIENIREKISNDSLKINPYFITGIIDGDGSLTYAIDENSFENTNDSNPLKLDIRLRVGDTLYSRIVLEIIVYYFKAKNFSIVTPKNKKGLELIINYSELLNSDAYNNHFINYACFSTDKQARFDLFYELCQKKLITRQNEKKKIPTRLQAIDIIKRIYNFEKKGRERTISLDSMLSKIENYYQA